jgi:Flp pilus assembly protein CpaB
MPGRNLGPSRRTVPVVQTPVVAERTNGAASGAPRRATGRRPALPNGRAVVGGLLVAAAAVGTYAAWSSADDAPSTRFAVAARDLAVGQVVEAGDLRLVAFDAPAGIAGAAFGEADAGLLVGQVTVAPVREGDLLQRSSVVVPEDVEPGRQVSFPIDVADALGGTLEEGERVDVLATFDEGETEVVVEDAVVARIRGGDEEGDGQLVVLLSVPDDADVLALTTAVRRGAITLVRTTGA